MKEMKTLKAEAIHGVRVVRSAGSKDRHSKVCTARGTRDRRVRLSPKTAILFYDVQDRLGYDRPSKVIDWLMKEAKAAIDALHHPSPTQVSKLECGTTQEHSNNPAGLGFSNQGDAPPPSMSRRSEDYQEQLLTHLELLDANSEIVGLQRSIGGEEEYSPPVSFQREPLQSSFWGINENSPEFQDFRFSGEDLCGVPTFQEDLLSESSRFLHYEEW